MRNSLGSRRRIMSLTTGLLMGAGLVLVAPSAPLGAQTPVPTFAKVFSPDTIGAGNVSTLIFTITNGASTGADDVAFSDTLPPGVTIADPANATTTCLDSTSAALTLSAPANGSVISLADAAVPAFASCTVRVDVTSATDGTHTNTSGNLTSSLGTSSTATDDLVVDEDLPNFEKDFAPDPVDRGERSTLTFTISNPVTGSNVGTLDFTDTLPIGMVIAGPANASTDCSGISGTTLTALAGGNVITLDANGSQISGFETLAPGESCTVSVDVIATAGGVLVNSSGSLLVDFDEVGKASATLVSDVSALHIAKDFTDDPIVPGATATLTFSITNFDRFDDATGVAFSDTLPTGVTVVDPPAASSNCGGVLDAADGSDTIELSGGDVAAGATCTITVAVTAADGGTYVNTTGTVSGTVGGSPITGNQATETLYVVAGPVTTKTFLDNPAAAGGSTTLEFTITNSDATNAATDIAFTDVFDTIIPDATSVPADGACGPGSDFTFDALVPGTSSSGTPAQLTLTGGELPAGGSCTFSVVLDISATAGSGGYANTTSEVTATVDGASVAGNPASDELLVAGTPPMRKTFASDVVAPGGQVDLTFTIANGGEGAGDFDAVGPVTGMTFTDDLGTSGLTFAAPLPTDPCGTGSVLGVSGGDTILTLTGGNLAEDESCSFTVTVEAAATATLGLFTNTTSDLSATVLGLAVTGPGASDTLLVTDVTASKSFTDPVAAGGPVTLTFTFDNGGSQDVTGISFSDDLSDTLPGLVFSSLTSDSCNGTLAGISVLSYSGGSVLAGQTCSIVVELTVPAGVDAAAYQNLTSAIDMVIGTTPVTLPPIADDLDIADLGTIDLAKEFIDDPTAPGGTATLRFTLSNAGGAVAGIAFTDDFATGITPPLGLMVVSVEPAPCGGSTAASTATLIDFQGGAVGAGGVCSFDAVVSVPVSAAAGSYTNTTSAVTADLGVTGAAASGILLVSEPSERNADLSISKSDSPDPVQAGSSLTYTVTVTNDGPDDAADVVVTDTLPAGVSNAVTSGCVEDPNGTPGCTLGTIAAGTSKSYTITVDVDAGTSGTITNAASVTSSTNDPDPSDNSTSEDTLVVAEADLSITKSDSPDPVIAGSQLVYTITVDNAGPADAADVVVTDTLPAGVSNAATSTECAEGTAGVPTCSLGTIAAGASVSYTITVDVDPSGDATLSNTATVAASTPDPDAANNTATETTTVIGVADLSITKTDKHDPVKAKNKVQYTITVFNAGPKDASNVVVTDTLPAGVVLHKTKGCAEDRFGVPTCSLGTIAAGSSKVIDVEVFVDEDVLGIITNTASVTSATPDNDSSNNTATEDTLIIPHTGGGQGNSPVSVTPTGTLPLTGSDGISSTLVPALGALLFGALLLVTSRRRRLTRAATR
ncbi:MAG: DUF11 domain-containing protein [Ilumatobacter sp.]|nr:DUF11 domain-containing protein [Ilumatobacter sp.]